MTNLKTPLIYSAWGLGSVQEHISNTSRDTVCALDADALHEIWGARCAHSYHRLPYIHGAHYRSALFTSAGAAKYSKPLPSVQLSLTMN
jgi:hypothetical protein